MRAARVTCTASAAAAMHDVAANAAAAPRDVAATPLRASPPAETEEAPTAQWLASLRRRRGTRSCLRQLPLGRRRAGLHEISNSALAGAGLVGRRPPLPDGDLGAAPVRARGVDNRRHRRGREFTKAAAAGISRRRSGRRVAGAVAAFVALYAFSALLATGLAPPTEAIVLWPLALLLWKACDPTLASFVAGAATAVGGPAIEVALLGGGGLFAEPFGHPLRLRPPGFVGRGVLDFARLFCGRPCVALGEPVAAARARWGRDGSTMSRGPLSPTAPRAIAGRSFGDGTLDFFVDRASAMITTAR